MSATPGPWNQIAKMNGFTAVGATTLLAKVYSTAFGDHENEEANAKLIAAAPETAAERDRLREVNAELLAALKPFAAIGLLLDEDHRAGMGDMIDMPCFAITPAQVRAARAAIAKADGAS